MEQMLSPGFSIPSIGTPLHQMEADQQIVASTVYHPTVINPNNNPNANTDLNSSNGSAGNIFNNDINTIMDTATTSASNNNSGGPNQQIQKQILSYNPPFQNSSAIPSSSNGNSTINTSQPLMQPQTPVSFQINCILLLLDLY